MIDFVKLDISYLGELALFSNPHLDFTGSWDRTTGVVHDYPLRATYNNLEIVIRSAQTIQLTGSLHKYWNSIKNGSASNFNDFDYCNLLEAIEDLSTKFGIKPIQTTIHNIEFGVNVILPFSPDRILNRLVHHRATPFSSDWQVGKHYKQSKKQQYIVKAYNKGLQYKQQSNIFRFELKIVRMVHLPGVTTLADLTKETLIYMSDMLVKTWNEILLWENVNPSVELSAYDRTLLLEGKNHIYWEELRERVPETYYKRMGRFRQLNREYGTEKIQEQIHQLILAKCSQLTVIPADRFQDLTDFPISPFIPLRDTSIPEFNSSSIGLIPLLNETIGKRFCKSCGRDITHQKQGSEFCSESVYGKVGKKCRNKASNLRNNLKRRIKRYDNESTLFDVNAFLVLSGQQMRILGQT